MSNGSSMCDAGFGLSLACAACITYAWRVGALNARWQKTFLLNLHLLIDTQGRGVHGPDERGLERLFTHNGKLYNLPAGRQAVRLDARLTNPQYEA